MRTKALIAAVLLSYFGTEPVAAHPGGTAADGCHYCRTNCDRWGVAWGERHCHGGRMMNDLRTISSDRDHESHSHRRRAEAMKASRVVNGNSQSQTPKLRSPLEN